MHSPVSTNERHTMTNTQGLTGASLHMTTTPAGEDRTLRLTVRNVVGNPDCTDHVSISFGMAVNFYVDDLDAAEMLAFDLMSAIGRARNEAEAAA
jgi:hypothetical protein